MGKIKLEPLYMRISEYIYFIVFAIFINNIELYLTVCSPYNNIVNPSLKKTQINTINTNRRESCGDSAAG